MSKFYIDDRGSFCDVTADSPLKEIKRVYICENVHKGIIRGFHYHEFEEKLFYVPRGTVKFVCFPLTKEQAKLLSPCGVHPEWLLENTKVETTILSAHNHIPLHVPAGYVNGWMTLEDDTILVGCSNKTLTESVADDIRIDPDLLMFENFWKIKNR